MFYIWIIGLIICCVLDDISYKKILKKEEKTKQIENFSLFDRHFHYVGGYISITILYLIWALNKI
jgi:uncharacterized membrane protein